MDVAGRIRTYISEQILFEEDGQEGLKDDTPLLEGVLDSINMIQLVTFLEEEFDIEVDEDAIDAEQFRTIGHIERLVQRILSESSQTAPSTSEA